MNEVHKRKKYTYLPTLDLYYNTQVYFKQNHMHDLENSYDAWINAYKAWLAAQGCEIKHSHKKDLIRTGIGVAPGHDRFAFRDNRDAIVFALRWS